MKKSIRQRTGHRMAASHYGRPYGAEPRAPTPAPAPGRVDKPSGSGGREHLGRAQNISKNKFPSSAAGLSHPNRCPGAAGSHPARQGRALAPLPMCSKGREQRSQQPSSPARGLTDFFPPQAFQFKFFFFFFFLLCTIFTPLKTLDLGKRQRCAE